MVGGSGDRTATRVAIRLALGAAVALFALGHLERGRRTNYYHVDESAYLAQTYFADAMLGEARDDPVWLSFAAADLPPGAKVAFGAALAAAGLPRPGPAAAEAWYEDNNTIVGTPAMLHAARRVAVGFGALGCLALFGIGTLAVDVRVGTLAGLLLAVNPLYAQQARRALADVPAEALALAALALLLLAWRRALARPAPRRAGTLAAAGSGGALAGLAIGTRLTGLIVPLVAVAWLALALARREVSPRRRAGVAAVAALAGIAGALALLAINPALTARPRPGVVARLAPSARIYAARGPIGRLLLSIRQRAETSHYQQQAYPAYALRSPRDKLGLAAVQGFGRFSPLGPRHSNLPRLYDRAQDAPVVLWLPLCALGALTLAREGRRQRDRGAPPTAWAALALAGIATATVVAYLPLAWDRYLLPIQPAAALLGAAALVAGGDTLARAVARAVPGAENSRIPGRQDGP